MSYVAQSACACSVAARFRAAAAYSCSRRAARSSASRAARWDRSRVCVRAAEVRAGSSRRVRSAAYATASKSVRLPSSSARSRARSRAARSCAATARRCASVSASRSRTMRVRQTCGSSAISRRWGGPTRTTRPSVCRRSFTTPHRALSTAMLVAETSRIRLPRATRSPMARFSTVVLPVPGGPHTSHRPSPVQARYARSWAGMRTSPGTPVGASRPAPASPRAMRWASGAPVSRPCPRAAPSPGSLWAAASSTDEGRGDPRTRPRAPATPYRP